MPRRRKRQRGMERRRAHQRHEWIGGRLTPPIFIQDRDEPYRPELVIWLASSGLIVGQEVVAPEEAEGAAGRVLLGALDRPLAGPKHRPDVIRVSDPAFALEVRAAVEDAIPVIVAPTPELDALVESLIEWLPESDDNASYFEDGRIAPDAVAELFTAADRLYRIAPWTMATDAQVLRMDIPALGVEGTCVSIIGNLGESLGVLIFPSVDGYEGFIRSATAESFEGAGGLNLGTDWLALNYDRAADLPVSMRREAVAHAWPVAGTNAYPRVLRIEHDGALRPLVARDVQIATVCAASLSRFFDAHRDRFEADTLEPVFESYSPDPHNVEVRFTFPYEAAPPPALAREPMRWPASSPRRGRTRPGRNDPCPCGSGRKFKKCCLRRDEQASSMERRYKALHALDGSLTQEIMDFAAVHIGIAWGKFASDFTDAAAVPELSSHWSAYHFRVDGMTALEQYLKAYEPKLSRAERAWLDAEAQAWLTVWEVTAVEPGISLTVRDLLSHEERHVHETSGSTVLGAMRCSDASSTMKATRCCVARIHVLPPLTRRRSCAGREVGNHQSAQAMLQSGGPAPRRDLRPLSAQSLGGGGRHARRPIGASARAVQHRWRSAACGTGTWTVPWLRPHRSYGR